MSAAQTRTRIKICGLVREADLRLAAELGADALGLVMVPASPRGLRLEQAQLLARQVPPCVSLIGLFMDADPAWIEQVLRAVPLSALQFHGSETARDCTAWGRPYLKSIAMQDADDPRRCADLHPDAQGYVLDGHAAGAQGGSGQQFDWTRVPRDDARRWILAGGLHAGNVAQAIRTARPWAVDVSSGVESAPGQKSAEQLRAFIASVQAV